MQKEGSKINFEKRPMPSTPGAQQITNEDLMSKKGGSEFVSTMPKKNVVPGPSKSDMSSSRP